MDPSEQPTNLVDLLRAKHPLDPASVDTHAAAGRGQRGIIRMNDGRLLNRCIRTLLLVAVCWCRRSVMRSQYPSWIDADIRQTLEQALMEAPAAGPPPPAANAYQQMLSDMTAQLRAKQYDIQHRQTQQLQARQQAQQAHAHPAQPHHHQHHSGRMHGTPSQRQSRDDSAIAQPQQSQRLSHQTHSLSQSQGARRPAGAPPSRLPTRSPMRSSRDMSSSRSGRPSAVRPASAVQPKVAQPRLTISVSPPLSPRSPRAAGGSGIGPISPAHRTLSPSSSSSSSVRLHGGHGSSGHAGGPPPPGGVWVPLEWFTDMEHKLANLAQMSGPASEQS